MMKMVLTLSFLLDPMNSKATIQTHFGFTQGASTKADTA